MANEIMCDVCRDWIYSTQWKRLRKKRQVKIINDEYKEILDVCNDCWDKFDTFVRKVKES